MSKAKQEIFCSYAAYLKRDYPDFMDLLDQTCSKRSLRLDRKSGFTGITLLVIDSKDGKAAVEKAIYASDDAEYEKGPEIMKSCIVYGHLPTVADWRNQQDDIVTSLGRKLKVASVSEKEVTLENGCKIVPDNHFRQTERSASKVAIWVVKSGHPMASDEKAEYKHAHLKSKTGSRESENIDVPEVITNRDLYFHSIVCAYDHVIDCARHGSGKYRLPLIEFAASLIHFIMNSGKYKEYLPDAMSVCNMGNSDIIFMMGPHCVIEPLLPDALIDEWWRSRQTAPIADTYKRAFEQCRGSCAAFEQRTEITKQFNQYRLNNDASLDTFNQLFGLYKTLALENKIFGVSGVFPQRVADRYRKYPALKLNEDDRRFFWEFKLMAFEKLLDSGTSKELMDIKQSISLFGMHHGALSSLSTIVMNTTKARKHLTGALDQLIMPIYYSNMALYIPGFGALPDHAVDIGNSQADFVDYNAYNMYVIKSVYTNVTEDMHELDRAAMMVMAKESHRYLNKTIPTPMRAMN